MKTRSMILGTSTRSLAAWLGEQAEAPSWVAKMADPESDQAEPQGTVTTVTASTATVDRMGDIVSQSWDLDSYERNPVILWNHDAHNGVIGRAISASMVEGNLQIDILWDEGADNPQGRRVARQFTEGFMSAVSVGFVPGNVQGRNDLEKDDPRRDTLGDYGSVLGSEAEPNKLLELSAVPIPANAEALSKAAEVIEAAEAEAFRARLIALIRKDPTVRRALAVAIETSDLGLRSAGDSQDQDPTPDILDAIAKAAPIDYLSLVAEAT